MCDVCMKLAWGFHFPNSTGMSQSISICVLLIVTFFLHIILLLLALCCYLVNTNISQNTTFATIVIFGQISTGPVDLYLLLNSFSQQMHICDMYPYKISIKQYVQIVI